MIVTVSSWIIPVGQPLLHRIAGFLVWCVSVSGPSRKIITLDRIAVVMASCLTLTVPSWNRIAVILDRVFIVKASYRTVSGPSRKIIKLYRITVVMASCLTLFVLSWNRIAVMLDSVVTVMASCRTGSVPSRKIER